MTLYIDNSIRRIVALATPLWDRTPRNDRPLDGTPTDTLDVLVSRWRAVTGRDERSTAGLAGYLAAGWYAAEGALPDWSGYLIALFDGSDRGEVSDRSTTELVHAHEMPFHELLLPLVRYARTVLEQRAGFTWGPLALVKRSFERQLLAHLCFLASLPLGLHFQEHKSAADPLSLLAMELSQESRSTRCYAEFVARMLHDGGLRDFFEHYPVLARLLGESIGQWIASTATLAGRLIQDMQAIRRVFEWPDESGDVAAIELDLSDRHAGGRTVSILTFVSGRKLVYKPRNLSAENGFFELIEWVNSCGTSLRLRAPKVLDASSHGWVEFVEHGPCRSEPEVERYYERCGMLLALLYVLRASDIHCGNLIASGEDPVVVDLETIIEAEPAPWVQLAEHSEAAADRVERMVRDTVMRTAMLPRWQVGEDGAAFDWSGLCAEAQQRIGARRLTWRCVNTDDMDIAYEDVVSEAEQSHVSIGDGVSTAAEHEHDVVRGFERVYRLLLSRRASLLAEGGPLESLRNAELRVLLRDTSSYARLYSRLLHPEFLRDGAVRSIELEILARPVFPGRGARLSALNRSIHASERAAIEQLDVPLFMTQAGSRALRDAHRVLESEYFGRPGFEHVCERIEQLSAADLERQVRFIGLSFYARYWTPGAGDTLEDPQRGPVRIAVGSSAGDLLRACEDIGQDLHDGAVRVATTAASWLALRYDTSNLALHLGPPAHDLYGGQCGIALFLGGLSRATASATHAKLARAALDDVCVSLSEAKRPLPKPNESCGANGLGGIIYCLTLLARWQVDEQLWTHASQAAARLTDERIERDRSYGVIAGVSGAILGLLTLKGSSEEASARDRAVACGDHLLRRRVDTGTGHRAWRPFWAERPLLGFGHGVAGIAHALLRLAAETGEPRFAAAAEEALSYEAKMFDERSGAWPDLRELGRRGERTPMVGWCSGASGIGLARLAMLDHVETPRARAELERALEITCHHSLDGHDHLCCGNLGRIDFLLEAGRRLGRTELLDEAHRRARWVVERAASRGGYALDIRIPGKYACPSFFRGTAGIGYSLLRLMEPDRFPCVLLLD
jgi:type 2 lantibiotic biosynthesis protein LanM